MRHDKRRIYSYVRVLVATGALISGVFADHAGAGETVVADVKHGTSKIVRIAVPATTDDRFRMTVAVDGVDRLVELERTSVRGPRFELLAQTAGGRFERLEAPPVATYRGWVVDAPELTVSAIVGADGVRATAWADGTPVWRVEPTGRKGATAAPGEHRLSTGATARVSVPSLTDDQPIPTPEVDMQGTPLVGETSASCGVDQAELGLDLASNYYVALGSSTTAVMAKVEESVNAVNAIYVRDALVEHRLGRVIIRTSAATDPYAGLTDSVALLHAVRTEWNTNQVGSAHDVASVISTAISYSGVAWLGSVCTDGRYAASGPVDDHTFDLVLRHEVGHSWGALDFEGGTLEGATIMSGNGLDRISGPELDAMRRYRSGIACLDQIGPYPTAVAPYAKLDRAVLVAGAPHLLDVLANDHDANCQATTIVTFDATTALGGTVTRSVGTGPGGRDQLRYTAPGVVGDDRFNYRIADPYGGSGEGLVLVSTCTPDSDGDGICDADDNCVTDPNQDQANCDGDQFGDVCDDPGCNTSIFETPVPALSGGVAIDLHGVKAVPRLVDWNHDGALDLLVFAGDGYIWRYMAASPTSSRNFGLPVKVQDAAGCGPDIRVGTGYTGGAFVDLNADVRPDLVVAGNDNRVRLYTNVGTLSAPAFNGYVPLQASSGAFLLPSSCGSRIDVADWDGDGLQDILAGDFNGWVTFYRNTGTATAPRFAAPAVQVAVAGVPIGEPYNTHPRVFDLNSDGVRDLAYGINWHYFQFCHGDQLSPHALSTRRLATDTTGAGINLRDVNGDDSAPDFADLNGDGVGDMVDGGLLGKVVVMFGKPLAN